MTACSGVISFFLMKGVIFLLMSALVCSCERKEQVEVEAERKTTTAQTISPLSNGMTSEELRELFKKGNNIVSIDPELVLDLERVNDYEFCADYYPEIYYLTMRGYKGSGFIAFKAAYSLAKTDANYSEEITSLITHAYYQSQDDFTIWSKLKDEEKKLLYKLLDDYPPIDWESEKAKYRVEAK